MLKVEHEKRPEFVEKMKEKYGPDAVGIVHAVQAAMSEDETQTQKAAE